MSRYARHFESFFQSIRNDIYRFCEVLNFKPTWQQKLVLDAAQAGHRRISCKSGQGPGKTTCAGLLGLWRTMRSADALTVVTAPTNRQAKGWLDELAKTLEKADPWFRNLVEITATKVRIAGRPKWGIDVFAASNPINAQGIHNDHLTIIVDEASGVKRAMIEQFEGTLTNHDAMFLMIGNPNLRDTAFFDTFNMERHRWHTITLNGEESPIVSQDNVRYLREKYGANSDVYRIRVLGEFPFADPNCVISSEDAEACTRTDLLKCSLIPRDQWNGPARQFGIDYARFGSDESVIYRRSGNSVVEWEVFHHQEPAHVTDRAFAMQYAADWKDSDCWFVADAGGMGQGVMFKFHDAHKNILEFHNGGSAQKAAEFDNKITEGWFHVAELMKKRQIHIPKDNRLIQQLSTRQYYTTAKGKLCLESKDEYKKRMEGVSDHAGSPDRADAFVLAFYDEIMAGAQVLERTNDRKRIKVRR